MELSVLGLLLILSAIVGFVAKAIVGFRGGGLLAAIGVGFVGALIGVLLANATGAPELIAVDLGGMRFPLAWATLGAIILVAILAGHGWQDSTLGLSHW
jgi:uncharacterized membrane protein YeaQ/YmgE (transglycosylase-associated protein family)